MSKPTPNPSQTKTCDVCLETKPLNKFYKAHDSCRMCTMAPALAITFADRAEAHKQEKEVKRLMKSELKKIARERIQTKKKKRRKAAIEKLMPLEPVVQIEVDAATKELAQRELSRRKLIEFIQEFHPRYKAGWVHHDICKRLEQFAKDVDAGKSPRLMILMPPRHGKSQIASKLYPAWHLGHYTHHEIIACSYNISLALEFSREVRGVVRSDRYHLLFPQANIDPDFQGAEAWKLLSKTGVGAGGYVAAGIGGPINGKGAHVLIIDDPIKNAEEADSPEHRNKIDDWYKSTAYTRLAPGGGVLIIQTWWHDDDLAGRRMAEMKANLESDQFEIVKYPAIAEEDEEFRLRGDPLHKERYDLPALEKIKKTLGGDTGRFWAALYQQNPIPADGAFFTKEMFVIRTERVNHTPLHVYQAWDFAIGEKRYNDWTVGITVAVDYSDNVHILDVQRFRTKHSDQIADAMITMYKKWGNVRVLAVEDGQIWRGFKPLLMKKMSEGGVYPTLMEHKALTDKQVRAQPLQGRMQARRVSFPREAPWVAELTREFLRFPAGMHDDQVDAAAWAIQTLIGQAPPSAPKPPKNQIEKTTAEKIRELSGSGDGGSMSA